MREHVHVLKHLHILSDRHVAPHRFDDEYSNPPSSRDPWLKPARASVLAARPTVFPIVGASRARMDAFWRNPKGVVSREAALGMNRSRACAPTLQVGSLCTDGQLSEMLRYKKPMIGLFGIVSVELQPRAAGPQDLHKTLFGPPNNVRIFASA